MDPTGQDINKKKKEIIHAVTGAIIEALQSGQLTKDEGRRIASYVLDIHDFITDRESLISFLEDITAESDIFKNILEEEKNIKSINQAKDRFKSEDEKKMEGIKDQLSRLSRGGIN